MADRPACVGEDDDRAARVLLRVLLEQVEQVGVFDLARRQQIELLELIDRCLALTPFRRIFKSFRIFENDNNKTT